MNLDDLLGKLMPLFEKKIEFSMEMSKRAMSLEERKEASKTDLEYRKLEAQITNDKDKLKWEKEKLTTAVKGDYDLQALRNSGMIDQERLKGLNEKEKQKIVEAAATSRLKYTTEAAATMKDKELAVEKNKSYLQALGTILGHAQEVSQTDLEGKTLTKKPTAEVGTAARSLMEQTGLALPAAPPKAGRNIAGEAEVAAEVLRNHEKAGTKDAARNYLNSLDPAVRAETLKLLNPGSVPPATAAAPGTQPAVQPGAVPVRPTSMQPTVQPGAAPVAPIPEARTPIPAIQSETPTVTEPVRPAIQPTAPPSAATPQKSFAAAGPLETGKTAFGGTPGGVLGEIWNRGSMQADKIVEQRKAEEEKQRALRRARGLTVGGF